HDPNFRYNENLFALARLRPGVTLRQANAYLDRKGQENIASEGGKSFGRARGWGMFSMPLTGFIGDRVRQHCRVADGASVGPRARSGHTGRLGRTARSPAAAGAGGKHRADCRRSRTWIRGGEGDCAAVAALSARHAGHANSAFLPWTGAAVCDWHCRAVLAALRTGSGV